MRIIHCEICSGCLALYQIKSRKMSVENGASRDAEIRTKSAFRKTKGWQL